MTSQPDVPPPRIAQWLVSFFVPTDSAESILGDLLEEFHGLVTKSGVLVARSWYRRQALKTVVQAGGDAFRTTPLPMLIAVIGGFWLVGFATRYLQHAIQGFLMHIGFTNCIRAHTCSG